MAETAGEALWRFSLAFYARPGVADALVALQDKHGRDVNLALFVLWHGLSGRGPLDAAAVTAAEHAIAPLRQEIVEPLRRLRRHLRADPAEDVQRLRRLIKELEIEAEKLVQFRLAQSRSIAAGSAEPLADALQNLDLYIGQRPETAVIREQIQLLGKDRTGWIWIRS